MTSLFRRSFAFLFLCLLCVPVPGFAADDAARAGLPKELAALPSGVALPTPPKPLEVVASFSILGDMVREVGGGLVHVTTLVGPDGDAHSYEPTPEDVKALAGARLVFVSGLGLEGWMDRLIEASGTKAKRVVASKGVKPLIAQEGAGKATDPHAWQDLSNGVIYAENIASALEAALPGQAAKIKLRAAAYEVLMKRIDTQIRASFAAIPVEKRRVITSHDAFGYFGAAYGVTFLAPEGLSTEAEPSAQDVAKLETQIKAEKITTLFVENMTSARLIQQIGRDTGAKMGGTLYSDALSKAEGPAPTYLTMFEHNWPLLQTAMRGEVAKKKYKAD